MSFLLSSQNVFDYLDRYGICSQIAEDSSRIEHKIGRNFNLLLSLPDSRTLLVKQECYAPDGKTAGGFLNEWQIQKFLQEFPSLSHLRLFTPEMLHFNPEHSIIVFNYLKDYRDLMDFYLKENVFPTTIASTIGAILAKFHRATFNRQSYRDFFSQGRESVPVNGGIPHIIRRYL